MMRRILLLLTVVALMVGMSVLPASAQPELEPAPIVIIPEWHVGPLFVCTNPDTGAVVSIFSRQMRSLRLLGFTDCTLYPLYEPPS